ncbi:MAG: CBS domain-containing protein [Sedimentisphaerales bacterium]|nr:CBS domain-containing protein [Sedimentisphaerales bacterium]
MTATMAIDTTARIIELSDAAYQSFCEGITSMFEADVRCDRRQAGMEAAGSLRDHFKKLTAIHVVSADGALTGTFHLLFDQAGLFILSGVVIMLPEKRILEQVKRGSMENTESLQDAAREVGNLLVGSWDTVFREQCKGHRHFLKKDTFIGKLWDKPGQMPLSPEDQVLAALYDMTVEPYPSFTCAVVFPKSILGSVDNTGMEPGGRTPPQQKPADVNVATPGVSADDGDSKRGNEQSTPASDVPPRSLTSGNPACDVVPAAVAQAPVPADRGEPPTKPRPPDEAPPTAAQDTDAAPREPDPVAPLSRQTRAPDGGLTELLRTPVARIMQRDIVWATPEDTVQAVLAKMQQHNAGYVLIGQNGDLEGLVSNSNILGAVSLYLRPVFAKWHRPEDDATLGVKVKWIMSRPVRTIGPDTTLEGTIESMRRCGGRCLPVVDEKGAVQGIVTTFDILLYFLQADGSLSWKGKPPQAPALLL